MPNCRHEYEPVKYVHTIDKSAFFDDLYTVIAISQGFIYHLFFRGTDVLMFIKIAVFEEFIRFE